MPIPTAKLFEVVEKRIAQMQEAHALLSGATGLDAGDQAMLVMIDDWARKIAGVMEGHGAEFELYYKHRIKKRREIRDKSSKIADVAIGGDDDAFAKAIQSKSTVQTSHVAIDNYIKDALVQLTGEKGENPRPNDRPVIHMKIWDLGNPWPYTAVLTQRPAFEDLRNKVVERVGEAIKDAINQRLGQSSFNLFGSAPPPNKVQQFVNTFPTQPHTAKGVLGNNRPHATPQYYRQSTGGQYSLIKTLVVKIKWPFGLPCSNGGSTRFVESFTLVGTWNGSRFNFNVEKQEVSDPMALHNILN